MNVCPKNNRLGNGSMNVGSMLTGMSLSHGFKFNDSSLPNNLIGNGEMCDSRTGMSPSASVGVGF